MRENMSYDTTYTKSLPFTYLPLLETGVYYFRNDIRNEWSKQHF
jgi:hypothetical protein